MNIEIEQIKNDLSVKVGTLHNKIKRGEIHEDYLELVKIFEEYEAEGTTLEELKLLYDNVLFLLGK